MYFLFLLPWGISFIAFMFKWKDDKYKLGKVTIPLVIISLLFACKNNKYKILKNKIIINKINQKWLWVYNICMLKQLVEELEY